MNALEINTETQTATQAILANLADGERRSAKQIYERSDVLENRQEANKVLWDLRQRGYVESAPATGDLSDPAARLVWSITEAGRAYLAGDVREAPGEATAEALDTVPVHVVPVRQAKPKAKSVASVTVPNAKVCAGGGVCHSQSHPASGAQYRREILGVVDGMIDVYSVLLTFDVTCQARGHAIKKLLCPGIRGTKNELQDLIEARDAITRAIQMVSD